MKSLMADMADINVAWLWPVALLAGFSLSKATDSLVRLDSSFQNYELQWQPYTQWNFSNPLSDKYCIEPHCLRSAHIPSIFVFHGA
jgi:hypothetical protein